jgi:hypothetical protein
MNFTLTLVTGSFIVIITPVVICVITCTVNLRNYTPWLTPCTLLLLLLWVCRKHFSLLLLLK